MISRKKIIDFTLKGERDKFTIGIFSEKKNTFKNRLCAAPPFFFSLMIIIVCDLKILLI